MTADERKYLAAVINYFWGAGTVTPAQVNTAAATVAFEALEEAKVCSKSMDLVPRPKYGAVDLKYVIKQLTAVGKRVMANDTKIYLACRSAVGVRYKTRINMAIQGI